MTWTTDKPTQPGWYWYQGGMDEVDTNMAFVGNINGILKAMFVDNQTFAVQCLDGRWAGPLAPPV